MGRVYRFRVREVIEREIEIRDVGDNYADARAIIDSGDWDGDNVYVSDGISGTYQFTARSLGSKVENAD